MWECLTVLLFIGFIAALAITVDAAYKLSQLKKRR